METAGEAREGEAIGQAAEVERLEEELRREHTMYLQVLADFESFRRRVERERANIARACKRELILPLIETLDGFDRALSYLADAPGAVYEGLRAVQRQLLKAIEAQGVFAFDGLGQAFDPALHEEAGSVESPDHEPGLVLDVVSRGYRWGEEVLRPARVRVARAKDEPQMNADGRR